jgi:hypothetical protein
LALPGQCGFICLSGHSKKFLDHLKSGQSKVLPFSKAWVAALWRMRAILNCL